MFDMLEEIAAIHRAVARDDAAQTVTVTLSRRYAAPVEVVWDAMTKPERIQRWFYPITGDLTVGGTYQSEGNAGGEIRRCDKPNRFEVTWGGPESVVDVRLTESDGATTLEFTHSVPLAMAQSGAGALFVGPGWDGALLGLGIYLSGDAVGDPLEAASSPQVIEFNKGSIDAWTTAIESSGTATADEIAALREVAIAQYTVLPG